MFFINNALLWQFTREILLLTSSQFIYGPAVVTMVTGGSFFSFTAAVFIQYKYSVLASVNNAIMIVDAFKMTWSRTGTVVRVYFILAGQAGGGSAFLCGCPSLVFHLRGEKALFRLEEGGSGGNSKDMRRLLQTFLQTRLSPSWRRRRVRNELKRKKKEREEEGEKSRSLPLILVSRYWFRPGFEITQQRWGEDERCWLELSRPGYTLIPDLI